MLLFLIPIMKIIEFSWNLNNLKHVKYLKLVHDICSYMLPIIIYPTTRILSTPSNKMTPKYYFTFLELIPIKSGSAAIFTVALGGHALGGFQMSVWETLCWKVI